MDDKKFQALSKPQQDLVVKIAAEAERQGVRPELALAVAEAETGGAFSHYRGDKVLTSPAGARGVMQIMPDTANLYNKKYNLDINPDDEDSNIKGGVAILKDLLTTYKSPRNAVALYNASPRAVSQFMKLYETDPDKAILSLPNETRNYSLRIAQNFNLDDDKETGLIPETKEASRFEGYESEATKFKREQEEAARNKPPVVVNPEDKQGGITAPDVGAALGAGANVLLPPLTNPQLPAKIDTSRAQERALETSDKLDLARQNLQSAVPQGTQELEDAFKQSQGELERLKNEQRLAQERLKGLPKAPPSMEPPAPSSPFPQQVEVPSRTKAGDAGAVNWVHSMSDDVPDVVANKALNMRGDNPRGGQAIIDANAAAIEKQASLGLGDYGLTRTEGGVQLALPPTTVAERQADIEKQSQASQAELQRKTEEARVQQEAQARQLEMQRLSHEADLESLRQQRSQLGQQHNELTGQVRTAAPLQRALTKAETDAEVARRKLARAQEQPSALVRPLDVAGVKSAKMGALPRAAVGAGAGYLGVMSYQEALARLKAGDTSEAVLQALQAGSAAAMLTPPVGKGLTRLRGAGTIGTGALGAYQIGRRLLKERPPEE
jgi:TolA-binding protein